MLAVIGLWPHPIPFRTRKLSAVAVPMVLEYSGK